MISNINIYKVIRAKEEYYENAAKLGNTYEIYNLRNRKVLKFFYLLGLLEQESLKIVHH